MGVFGRLWVFFRVLFLGVFWATGVNLPPLLCPPVRSFSRCFLLDLPTFFLFREVLPLCWIYYVSLCIIYVFVYIIFADYVSRGDSPPGWYELGRTTEGEVRFVLMVFSCIFVFFLVFFYLPLCNFLYFVQYCIFAYVFLPVLSLRSFRHQVGTSWCG